MNETCDNAVMVDGKLRRPNQEPLWVRIEILSEGRIIQEKEVNYHSRKGRQDIAKTACWAYRSGHTMVTIPLEEVGD